MKLSQLVTVSTDALGGAAPNGRIMAGGERAVQSPSGLKSVSTSLLGW